jgi:transposase-like protein
VGSLKEPTEMKRRKWSSTEKLQIVLEGLKATMPLAELCTRHQISQSQYYQWRDRLLHNGAKVFEQGGPQAEEERLRRDNQRLKALIGELTVELKKNDEVWS